MCPYASGRGYRNKPGQQSRSGVGGWRERANGRLRQLEERDDVVDEEEAQIELSDDKHEDERNNYRLQQRRYRILAESSPAGALDWPNSQSAAPGLNPQLVRFKSSIPSIDPSIDQQFGPSLFFNMASSASAVKYIMKRPWLKSWFVPLAEWYKGAAGYRQLGLRSVFVRNHLNS